MTARRAFAPTLIAGLAAIALAAPAAHAGAAFPGSYAGKAAGVKATIEVAASGATTLRYSLRTKCGADKGRIAFKEEKNGRLKAKRLSRGPHSSLRTTRARLVIGADGTELAGKLRDALSGGGEDSPAPCRAKRGFTATLAQTTAAVSVDDLGHYAGANAGGLPISFDVVHDPTEGIVVENLAVHAGAECWQDLDGDGADDTIVARLGGLSGTVDWDGAFEVNFTEGDDVEYDVEGVLAGGRTELEVTVGGYFDPTGAPSAAGPLECDSFGEAYSATRQ